ncbi:oxidoreductase [Latilactobacillus sakei]|jgi:NADP-dependent 3-hydroxy acid dehydrogenase YdfG|uniref:NADP-dependent 3-hydroxy acid dehydrogenase YdfG n=1 Tax=Latilactobacillus sakei TaxID=1599 RepID=A0A9N7PBC5_LATSK|nr:SDR family oxidoreductase [Latilactobacillus sakei]AST84328.1 NAD(P)-dependent oxidoreductase [Latilactobacillus sakei]AWZ42276.1 NAD(P)-dependent oxidoreductase [Latilactobacillus sakei]AWZ46554.1 NAD(P)-dependent oxidoreductase [Latilactobacillus sakei]AYG15659.1 SDR family oxidoreductase [Latilactobacillus sakei]AYG26171.1 SDR family oxidoreductase [Latilactobacillus sakei]
MNKPLIVITGASSGFGAEIAKIFNAAGYPELLLGRRTAKIEALPLNFENVLIESVDVTDQAQFKAAIQKAEAKFGPTDLLVNNAGVMLLGNVLNQDAKEWQTMLDTNVMGVLNGTQIVLPAMVERQHGTIINMSSLAGRKTFVNHAAYVASKFGVHGLSETIREEVSGKNVRISMVAPGAAETELLTHVTDQGALTDYQAWKDSMGGITLDPVHVAKSVKFIYDMPQSVNIRELDIAATRQDS